MVSLNIQNGPLPCNAQEGGAYMLEIPEAATIAMQCKKTIAGKTIQKAVAGMSPHGLAWYTGDPSSYSQMLEGRTIRSASYFGGRMELLADELALSFNDGVNARYLEKGEKRPDKHQLLLEFEDGDALYCTVQMYGGICCFPKGSDQGFYDTVSREKPSPLSDAFDEAYFSGMLTETTQKLSAKAFLATEQRIPGLGNGCLQDILWNARVHPKRKMNTLADAELETLFHSVKRLLAEMTEKGGRDTEKDLFGKPGGYMTVMSKKNAGGYCPHCGGVIKRMAYMGGNIYVCEGCQRG